MIEPELEAAKLEVGDLAADIGDVLTYVLSPTSGKRFLRWKWGLEAPPAETRGKTSEDIRLEDELLARIRSGGVAVDKSKDGAGFLRRTRRRRRR